MSNHSRRDVLKGIAGGAVVLSSMGVASAADGREEYVVTAPGNGIRKRLEREGIEVRGETAGGDVFLVAAESRSAVADVGGVRTVEPNEGYRPVGPAVRESAASTDDELADLQWDKTEETTGAFAAHEEATGEGSTVAIIDTGIDTSHPDLRTRAGRGGLFRADGETSPSGDPFVPGDTTIEAKLPQGLADGSAEELDPYVYRGAPTTREQAAADDVQSHGSHCAGIATGKNDGTTGIAGMAPDADVVPLRVFYWTKVTGYVHERDDGTEEELTVTTLFTTDFDILSAIDYAAELGADAANMSLGGDVIRGSAHKSGEHVAYQTVVQRAVQQGTVVTASAGNAESNLQQGGYYTLPNSVPGAVSVSATGPTNELAFYSNYGTSDVDVGAPGGGYETLEKSLSEDTEYPYPTNLVLSTVPAELNEGTEYDWYAGTSMAAPQVAGLVALVREVNPDLNAKQVQQIIERTARFSNGSSSPDIGAGIIYAPDAVAEAARKGGK
ncbi:S8 family peptidase [Halopelagius longus]|uniref:Serine protease, subtilisin family n=2 Tax=Halopelagius longus TaxID=1236180 RepID=A0A1H0YYU0_9EURY|nr:S8 family serine peptidase [Halopelagius longus]SDQ20051.1 Serine protease, subtilisin family [Halopelagius longus]